MELTAIIAIIEMSPERIGTAMTDVVDGLLMFDRYAVPEFCDVGRGIFSENRCYIHKILFLKTGLNGIAV
jgi:hypothetical protein